ncbi:acyltransferase family protein [Ascidiimonas sp. W6]|uniref:acyltransferase family protein n=1 Tax=Ascidiimonas meishanensis TaxID=3128903 RepID=UPI0030ED8714
MEKQARHRLYHIDLLRFIAALYVVFYHYGFRGFAKDDMSVVQYEPLESFSKYGYLGVDLFFIISGFVILMSAKKSNIVDFCISRFSRLYPAYWVGIALTTFIVVFFGGERFSVTPSQVAFNITMLNGFFEIPYVDGVYWSLLVELKFYILIGFILLFNKIKYIKIFAYLLLGIAILQLVLPFGDAPLPLKVVYYFSFPRWSSYFIAGMFFFLIKSENKVKYYFIPILICYITSVQYAFLKADHYNEMYHGIFSYTTVAVLVTVFYIFMFLVSINQLQFLNKKAFLSLGVLTYPLYLIHQNIGFIALNNLHTYFNKWVLLSLLIIVMLAISFIISKYIEKPFGNYIRQSLKKNTTLINLKSKLKPQ